MRRATAKRLKRAAALGTGLLIGAVVVAFGTRHLSENADIRLCRAVLPAIEPEGKIVVDTTSVNRGTATVVEIGYRVVSAAGTPSPGQLRCAVREATSDPLFGRPELAGVEENGRVMGDARLFFLKRFWLGDPGAVAEGERRLGDAPVAASRG
jgi:hypothetical protein